jgi:tetratricopeptide (TPR) repeat protein
LFPFLLVFYEWTKDRRMGPARRRDAAALVLLPFLFLIPWIVMNWRLTGRLVVFEDGRADNNIITGALGFVRTLGIGDSRSIADIPLSQNAFLWAVSEILRHPLRFLSAVGQRAAYAASLHPLLVVAAAASMWTARKREDCRALALLAVYFFGIHCLMPVQENYFVPVWPILIVLAVGLFSSWTQPASARLKALSTTAVCAALALLLAAPAAVLGLVLAYPARAQASGALDRELLKHPNDPWLWSERGMRLLRQGRAPEASGDLARAFALDPSRDRELNLSWALLASGAPAGRMLERPGSGRILMNIDLRERVLQAVALSLQGRRSEAVAVVQDARDSLPAVSSPLRQIVLETISSWPAAKRPAVIGFFSGIPGFEFARENELAQTWLDTAATVRGGSEILAFTGTMKLDPAGIRRLARAYRDSGDHARALSLLKKTEMAGPTDADMLLDIAARAAGVGQRAAVLESLALAERLTLDPSRTRSLALAYRDIGLDSRALAVMKRPEMAGPAGFDLILDMAAAAAKGGKRREALEMLAFVESSKPDPERMRRWALAYQDAGSYDRALAVMKRTDMAGAKDVYMLLDMAAKAARTGELAAARECLAFAESLKLDAEKIRTLALSYRDIGDYARALAVLKHARLSGPKDAGMLLDLAVRAARDDQRPAALASLAYAESLNLDAESLRGLALGYRALGESRSLARVRRLMGDDSGLELDQAEAALAAGDKKSAAAHLARVRDLSLVEPEARRLVLMHQNLGDYRAALEVVKRRVRSHPGDAQWRNDSGVLHSLLGERDEAIADWSSAIALDPDGLTPYLSLGSLYSSLNRREEALDVYQRAAARRHTKESAGVLRQILAELKKIRASPPANIGP